MKKRDNDNNIKVKLTIDTKGLDSESKKALRKFFSGDNDSPASKTVKPS
ncbi:MAG: hypothetical protein ILA15_08800 [Clostridiales bacterium]|nr:hypothetical protein [Clostridiales bacterium]